MTEPTFPEKWCVKSSTSRFFPVHSKLFLKPKQQGSNVFELEVDWEGLTTLKLSDPGFEEVEPGTLQGDFGHPKTSEKFRLVVTLCCGKDRKARRHLCGRLFDPDRGDEATGVWVAEEQRPPIDPPGNCT